MPKAPAIGIDLGTTYSCVGVYEFGEVVIIANDHGSRTTPSYVAFTNTDTLIGDPAKAQALKNTKNTIFDVKRLIGRKFQDSTIRENMKNWPFQVINDLAKPKIRVEINGEAKIYCPEQISSMILSKMKETAEAYLGEKVTDAVITVPAYFNDNQRTATKDAGKIAGLNVLRIINEPTAAALAYGLERKDTNERNILIFDLGGGTFDVSILTTKNGSFEVKSTAGNTNLGGQDFDNSMINHFVQEFKRKHKKDITKDDKAIRRLRTTCEKAKKTLSTSVTAGIDIELLYDGIDFYSTISRARFEELNANLFRSTIQLVEKAIYDARMNKSQIDDVVLVGGSSRIPKVQTLLQEFFNGKELNKSINPDEAVAHGAAILAAILTGDKSEVQDVVLLDVTPLSLGICVEGYKMSVVVSRNTTIPAKKTKNFTTMYDNQRVIRLVVLEGEYDLTKKNHVLGELTLTDIVPAPVGVPQIEVTFDIDADGILHVTAIEKETENTNSVFISYDTRRLSKEEIEDMIIDSERLKTQNKERSLSVVARNKLEEYCYFMKTTVEKNKSNNKLREDEIEMIMNQYDETMKWIHENQSEKEDKFKQKQQELEIIFNLIVANHTTDIDERCAKYYEILGVGREATTLEIEEAFSDAAIKYHPDKFQGDKELANWMWCGITTAKKDLINLLVKRRRVK